MKKVKVFKPNKILKKDKTTKNAIKAIHYHPKKYKVQ
jgi:hypothetical protein